MNSRWRIEVKIFSQLLEHGSDRHETLPKRVSDDSGRFVFGRRKKKIGENFGSEILFFANLAWFWASHGSKSACS